MIQELIGVLNAGLSLWDSKEKTKYQDQYLRLVREWNEEMDQPEDYRSQLALDRIERELRQLARSFTYSVGAKNAPNK